MKTRVVLADDHKIIREGLRTILEGELRCDVVALTEDGASTVEAVRLHQPDIVIMDISMPGVDGIAATREILREHPQVKVIALSMHTERGIISEMLSAGARAYLLKDCASDDLGRAMESVLHNKVYISPAIAGVVVDDYVHRLKETKSLLSSNLTAKERQVLQLIAGGKSTKEIAAELHVSVQTIDTHRQHIMDKLKLYSIADLTKYAIREGLASLGS